MARLRERARQLRVWARIGGAVAVVGIIGGVAAIAGEPPAADAPAAAQAPVVADLPGRPLVDREGRPVLDAKGRPLRVAPDGKTLLDSTGRPLTDAAGQPLRLGSGNRVPAAAVQPRKRDRGGERDRSRGRAPRQGRRPRPKRPASGPPIRIGAGFIDLKNHDRIGRAYGVVARTAPFRPQIRAVVDHINATGGILGRPIELLEFEYDPAGGGAFADVYNELCRRIAEKKPLLVVERHGHPKLFVPCMAERGIPVVASWPVSVSTAFFSRWAGFYISPGMLATDQIARPYVQGLLQAGFFTPGAKVGLLHNEAHELPAFSQALREELGRRGIKIAAEASVDEIDSVHELATSVAQIQSAAVQFKLAGVTHVLPVDQIGSMTGLFMRFAHEQRYYPRYGLNSGNAPVWLPPNLVPPQSDGRRSYADTVLRDAVGVGWSPMSDVTPQDDPPSNATRRTCEQIFEQRGIDVGDRSPYAEYAAYGYCDAFLLVRAALERSRNISPEGLRAGVEALGSSFPSALNLGTTFGPGRLFGASGFRLLAYHPGCRCFRYGAPVG